MWKAIRYAQNKALQLSILPALLIFDSSPAQFKSDLLTKIRFLQEIFFLSSSKVDLSNNTNFEYLLPISTYSITILEIHQAIMKFILFKSFNLIFISNIIL